MVVLDGADKFIIFEIQFTIKKNRLITAY